MLLTPGHTSSGLLLWDLHTGINLRFIQLDALDLSTEYFSRRCSVHIHKKKVSDRDLSQYSILLSIWNKFSPGGHLFLLGIDEDD